MQHYWEQKGNNGREFCWQQGNSLGLFFLTLTHKRGRKCSTSSYRQLSLSFIHCNLMTWTSKGSSDSSCYKRQCLQEVEDIIKKKTHKQLLESNNYLHKSHEVTQCIKPHVAMTCPRDVMFQCITAFMSPVLSTEKPELNGFHPNFWGHVGQLDKIKLWGRGALWSANCVCYTTKPFLQCVLCVEITISYSYSTKSCRTKWHWFFWM